MGIYNCQPDNKEDDAETGAVFIPPLGLYNPDFKKA